MKKLHPQHKISQGLILCIYIILSYYMPVDTKAQSNANKNQTKRDTIATVQLAKKNKIIIKTKIIISLKKDSMAFTDFIPLIGDAANAASTLITNKQNIKQANRMFDKTNAYNTPANQVKRMKEAGLNPALMYQGSPQNTAQSMRMPEMVAPQVDPQGYTKGKLNTAQATLTNENSAQMATKTDLLNTNINLLQTKITDLESIINERENYRNPNTAASTAAIQNETELNSIRTMNEVDYKKKLSQSVQQSISASKQEQKQSAALFPISKQVKEEEVRKLTAENATIRQNLSNLPEQQRQIIEKMRAEVENIRAQKKSVDWNNLFNSYQKDLRAAGFNPMQFNPAMWFEKFGQDIKNAYN